jgi:hypothetical protein
MPSGSMSSGWAAVPAASASDTIPHRLAPSIGCAWSGGGFRAHTGDMGRTIGTILGAILAIWVAFTAAGGIFATLKTFVIVGLIALAVFIVVWIVARRPRRD